MNKRSPRDLYVKEVRGLLQIRGLTLRASQNSHGVIAKEKGKISRLLHLVSRSSLFIFFPSETTRSDRHLWEQIATLPLLPLPGHLLKPICIIPFRHQIRSPSSPSLDHPSAIATKSRFSLPDPNPRFQIPIPSRHQMPWKARRFLL